MNNSFLFGILLSAFLIGGGSVYVYMSSQKIPPAQRANSQQTEQLRLLSEQVTSLNAKVDLLFEMQAKSVTGQDQASMLTKPNLGSVAFQESKRSISKSAEEKAACKDAAGTIALVNLATGMGMTSAVAECE